MLSEGQMNVFPIDFDRLGCLARSLAEAGSSIDTRLFAWRSAHLD